jgi:putative tricarboxylic transport membrane protein
MPVISLICLVGIYSVRNSIFDVWIMIAASVAGYFLRKWKFPIAPSIIGVVLGPTTGNSVRQSLMMFKGDLSLMLRRPLATASIGVALVFVAYILVAPIFGKNIGLKVDEDDKL